jgi:hypothetical protein
MNVRNDEVYIYMIYSLFLIFLCFTVVPLDSTQYDEFNDTGCSAWVPDLTERSPNFLAFEFELVN